MTAIEINICIQFGYIPISCAVLIDHEASLLYLVPRDCRTYELCLKSMKHDGRNFLENIPIQYHTKEMVNASFRLHR